MGELVQDQSKDQGNSNRGYTLVELMIVMSIFIMVALLSQSWLTSQLPKWRLNGATRQVVSDFRGAKMQAVIQGNKHRVTFVDAHHYNILDDDNSNGKPDPGELLVTRNIQTDYIDVTLTSTNNPIFHPRGTASNLGTVTLKNSAGSKSISVGITGRVKVQSLVDRS
ncbi:MAG: GspH/FimT family pseudopilin [Nitrospirota bacterium]|nr:MAG: GspH/FimT family pseudopilin [Nitrospirota bacterium]